MNFRISGSRTRSLGALCPFHASTAPSPTGVDFGSVQLSTICERALEWNFHTGAYSQQSN
eukprot:2539468-Prymnesium_polylepis.1